MEFDFRASPIPINASELILQVVFRGPLGPEPDAIAVSTKDIAEPNFLGMLNVMDFVFDVATDRYHPLTDYGAQKQKMTNVGLTFFPGTPMIGTLPELDGGQFTRVAFLTDTGAVEGKVAGSRGDITFEFEVKEFGLDPNDRYLRTCPLNKLRGIYWEFLFFYPQIRDGFIIKSGSRDEAIATTSGDLTSKRSNLSKATCGWGTGGMYDMTSMPALDPAQAIAFPISSTWKWPAP